MYRHVVFAALVVFLGLPSDVTPQDLRSIFLPSPVNPRGLARTTPGSYPKPKCMLQCPLGYVPGSCVCQDNLFPFIFSNTLCRFTKCPENQACQIKNNLAVCVPISSDAFSEDVCNLPAKPGPCKVYIQRYYFDKRDGTCKTFAFGGCQGNGNSFATPTECEERCIADVPVAVASTVESMSSGPVVNPSPLPAGRNLRTAICQLPKDPGPCYAYIPSFYFNSGSGQCESFIYGGCRGNDNRFKTLQDCQRACPTASPQPQTQPTLSSSSSSLSPSPSTSSNDKLSRDPECNLPKVVGVCRGYFPSFFYNRQTGECESFVYGGCRGNANRFESRPKCELKCKAGSASVAPNLSAACLQPKRIGRCRASIPRWFYDQDRLSCRLFYYGGCDANDNNFLTEKACQQLCVPGAGPPTLATATGAVSVLSTSGLRLPRAANSRPQRCLQPKMTGPCRASMPMFYFNSRTSRCERFIYGGCRGNENRFENARECSRVCQSSTVQEPQSALRPTTQTQGRPTSSRPVLPNNNSRCSLPKKTGVCRARMPRYYHNANTGRCQFFVYGGCGGNKNNFRSRRACERACEQS